MKTAATKLPPKRHMCQGPLYIRTSDFFRELGHVFVVETGDAFTGKQFTKIIGHPVAYCHREEDAKLFSAAPGLLVALKAEHYALQASVHGCVASRAMEMHKEKAPSCYVCAIIEKAEAR